MEKAISRAMILAAGLGTRFKPWTDHHPKALAPINGKSLLQRNIEYLQHYGIRDIVVNVHHFAPQIIKALTDNNGWGSHITISDESDAVLETGGGLKKAAPLLQDRPFVLMNVDILTDLDLTAMIADHFIHRPLATLAVTTRETSRYFLFNGNQELRGWKNVKTGEVRLASSSETATPVSSAPESLASPLPASTLPLLPRAFSGIHIIDPSIFPLIDRDGKFSIVDLYLDLARNHTIRGFDHSRSKLVDVGKPESIAIAESLFP